MALVAALLVLDILLALPESLAPGALPRGFFAVELPLILGILWVSPGRWRRLAATAVTAIIVFALVLRIANTVTTLAFNRLFDPITDPLLLPAGWDFVARSYGALAVGAAAALGLVIIAAISLAIGDIVRRVVQPPQRRLPKIFVFLVVALLAIAPGPWSSFATACLFRDEARAIAAGLRANAAFKAQVASDPVATIPSDKLYSVLRDHDVIVVFVESYGRVAIDGPRYGSIDAQLDAMTKTLAAAGFGARSAWLTSSTFGGQSWLAHAALLAGSWTDTQPRFNALLKSHHPTMMQDFHRAGWRTVAVMPEITADWPLGRYLAPDRIYDAPALSFRGAPFGYITMPDQFTMAALQARELGMGDRPRVMALVALVSSHVPWTPLPKLVPWTDIGSGAIFDQAREGNAPQQLWADPEAMRMQYGRAIAYDLAMLQSFILTYGNDRTVMIVLGDHQPMGLVTREVGGHDVPIHLIARDPAVLAAMANWHWTEGMRPGDSNPAWRMDSLRARFALSFSGKP